MEGQGAGEQGTGEEAQAVRMTRRQFVGNSISPLLAAAIGKGVTETEEIQVTRHRVWMPGLKAPVRVAQVTDLHCSWCVSEGFIARVVERTNALRPDLVALTGDFVTHSSDYALSCAEQLARLRAPLGLYGVLGNHDYMADGWQGAIAVATHLMDAHVDLVINQNRRLDNGLWIAGLDDCFVGHPDPEAAFAGIRRGEPVLAMTHNPELFPTLRSYPCLTLAGHTHGGQINIPGITRYLIGTRARYLRGWFRDADPNLPGRMYVSRGLGVIGIPMRLRSYPEIAVFDLQPV